MRPWEKKEAVGLFLLLGRRRGDGRREYDSEILGL
jgi:hypothetical protein